MSGHENTTAASKYYCFTLNNPTDEEFSAIHGRGLSLDSITYLVFGHETGSENLIEHLQGYMELKNKVFCSRGWGSVLPPTSGTGTRSVTNVLDSFFEH